MNEHSDCKFFGHRNCKHSENEIIQKATQTIQRYDGGEVAILTFPTNEEIDAICSACDRFTPT